LTPPLSHRDRAAPLVLSETHFTVEVRSDRFHGLGLLHRHRHINELLKEEFSKGLHALSIKAKAPGEP